MNAPDQFGRTALHAACKAGNFETFKFLVAREDCNLNATTNAGITPIMMAVDGANEQLV